MLLTCGDHMGVMVKADLQYGYTWSAQDGDNPQLIGFPDKALLNRHEGYEVLDFMNRFMAKHDLKNKATGLTIEKIIKEHLPSDVRSHANVMAWIESNWSKYNK